MIETKIIASNPSEGDLKQVAHRADLHHRSEGEISIEIVVATEGQGERRAIDHSSREPQAASESPTWFVCSGVECPYGCARGQDRQ